MNTGKYIFAQVLSLINRYEFGKCVDRYNGDYRTRELNCWNQFVQLFFVQLTGRNGIRDICLCLTAHKSQLYHLGIKQSVDHSTLARANENRDWRIYADFGYYLINLVKPLYTENHPLLSGIDEDILVLDSTTISVSLTLMDWAHGKYSRGAVKMHTLLDLRGSIPTFIHMTDGKYHDVNALDEIEIVPGAIYVMDKAYIDFGRLFRLAQSNAFFVVRAKSNLKFKAAASRKVDKTTGLRCDQSIRLTMAKSRKQYPEKIRHIKYYDSEKDITLIFMTNNFDMVALEVTAVYKSRWQIEVFFKWIKQNLQVKTLWGHSENAVKTHLWIAICTYLTVAYLKQQFRSPYSVYEMTQILGISTFAKTPVNELFTEKHINLNIKEQLNLFNNSEL
ncbi:IS4 family transposase [Flavobacteriaceae bacterium F89]|uniref:IS4 family transposase n=1 Tax=Cerina litoralis TaxID=2874477 RepID=A0AAE3EZC9_9FLAO|nr:IS4 family transposase [Cerina litoralis]MCG2462506.1 IS4 family transposase [Cerina litoralis]